MRSLLVSIRLVGAPLVGSAYMSDQNRHDISRKTIVNNTVNVMLSERGWLCRLPVRPSACPGRWRQQAGTLRRGGAESSSGAPQQQVLPTTILHHRLDQEGLAGSALIL